MTTTDPLLFEEISGAGALDNIHDALDRAWLRYPEIPQSIRTTVAIAAAEIAANIVEHARPGQPLWIRVEMEVHPHRVTVLFTDNGDPAAVDVDAVRMPDDLSEHGRGLPLAHRALDALTYRRVGDRNHWTLVSRRFD